MRMVFAFLAGGLFGAGLYVSGMTDTTKVQGWLDIFGAWDPTLGFVFAGALIPMAVAWRVAAARRGAVLDGAPLPAAPDRRLDRGLIIGSALFGAGWGLVGLCPGPALASLGFGGWPGLVFLLAMGAGMLAAPPVRHRIDRRAAA
ncbi:MAG: hypothetical protein H5U19_11475 [Rhodobacteraceae bacterium]|jgi:uncharacterized membrane protein YedE/YeeE|nr:hypothetical protein [Paracoccaceae bacterium]